MRYPLSPDGMGRGVGVGEAVDSGPGILEHGGPEVGQWSVFIWGEPVLTVGKSFKPASGEQAGSLVLRCAMRGPPPQ